MQNITSCWSRSPNFNGQVTLILLLWTFLLYPYVDLLWYQDLLPRYCFKNIPKYISGNTAEPCYEYYFIVHCGVVSPVSSQTPNITTQSCGWFQLTFSENFISRMMWKIKHYVTFLAMKTEGHYKISSSVIKLFITD